MNRLLYLFALVNLVLGTGAFVVAGILKPISDALAVSIPAAGQAMTTYALATAVLVPIALVLTGGLRRKLAMQVSLLLFMLGNVVCALATSLSILLLGRALMGVGAMFTPLAAGLAVAMVEPAKRGKALALVFLGVSLAYVVGLPLGTWLGFKYDWHAPIIAVATASLLALIAVTVLVPRDTQGPSANFGGLKVVMRVAEVRWTLFFTLLYFTSIFCVFSYVGPVQQALNPMSMEQLSLTLAMFGVSGVAGTLIGGWANDRFGSTPTLRIQIVLLISTMIVLPFTKGSYALTMLVFILWGTAGFRYDGTTTITFGRSVAAECTAAAVAQHVDALSRHRARCRAGRRICGRSTGRGLRHFRTVVVGWTAIRCSGWFDAGHEPG